MSKNKEFDEKKIETNIFTFCLFVINFIFVCLWVFLLYWKIRASSISSQQTFSALKLLYTYNLSYGNYEETLVQNLLTL